METTVTQTTERQRRTPEEREDLEKRLLSVLEEHPHASKRELARRLGIHHSTVWYMRERLNASRNHEQASNVLFVSIAQQVRDLVIEEGRGLTDKQLSERVGVSLMTIKRWLKKLNIPTGKHRRFSHDDVHFRKMWEDGWSDSEIARVMGFHHQRIQRWRVRNGLIANIIHNNLRCDAACKSHTPMTLLDIVGSPVGRKKLDLVWAFGALGANRIWLKSRFPEVSMTDIDRVSEQLLDWRIPRHLKQVVRVRQLRKVG